MHRLTPARRNTPSTHEQEHVVEQYLSREVTASRIIGPFPLGAVPDLQFSHMGVIPKGHIPGSWRLITDLSFPPGESVNDGIEPAFCSLSCTSVEKVARAAQCLGPGTLMAKTDIQAAYHLVLVNPDDRSLRGHSFHIRSATAAAQAGLEDSTIQSLERWSSSAFL